MPFGNLNIAFVFSHVDGTRVVASSTGKSTLTTNQGGGDGLVGGESHLGVVMETRESSLLKWEN